MGSEAPATPAEEAEAPAAPAQAARKQRVPRQEGATLLKRSFDFGQFRL